MSWKYWDEKSRGWRYVAHDEIEVRFLYFLKIWKTIKISENSWKPWKGYNATLGNIGVTISRRQERVNEQQLGKE